MDLKVFSIYDSKAKVFMQPMFMINEGAAWRSFHHVVNNGDSDVSKYPEDFSLYMIGEYNDGTGALTAHAPEVMVNGLQVKDELMVDGDLKANLDALKELTIGLRDDLAKIQFKQSER